jgi:chromosome condensin MukBEF complex kleisin-like MukF subunit
LASVVASKGIRALVFRKKNKDEDGINASDAPVDQVRSQLYESVKASIEEIRKQNSLENWLKDTCNRMYSSMADSIDAEWENSLTSVEKSLSEIKLNLQLNEEKRKSKIEEIQKEIEDITNVVKNIEPIQIRLMDALESGRKEEE